MRVTLAWGVVATCRLPGWRALPVVVVASRSSSAATGGTLTPTPPLDLRHSLPGLPLYHLTRQGLHCGSRGSS